MSIKVVNDGLAIATNLLSGLGGTVPTFCAAGVGTTAADVTDSDHESEASGGTPAYARDNGTPTRVMTTVANDTLQVVGTNTFGASLAITEAGLFDAITAGVLFARSVFSAVNVTAGGEIEWTWKIALVSG